MTWRVTALARLLCPSANIPATTALDVLDADQGRRLALERGANVIMIDFTPAPYRSFFDIYTGREGRRYGEAAI